MKNSILILKLVLLLTFIGCKKKVTDVNKDFIGFWNSAEKYDMKVYSENYKTIEIKENSYAVFKNDDGFFNRKHFGKARIKGSVLHIGSKSLTIDEAPVRLGNVGNFWRMKLSGVTYYIDKDNLFNDGVYCTNTGLTVWNKGNSTIHAVMDGVSYTMLPNQSVQSYPDCFDCETRYTDDHGNDFSFFNTGCVSTIEVQ